jgi:hypothetical protein
VSDRLRRRLLDLETLEESCVSFQLETTPARLGERDPAEHEVGDRAAGAVQGEVGVAGLADVHRDRAAVGFDDDRFVVCVELDSNRALLGGGVFEVGAEGEHEPVARLPPRPADRLDDLGPGADGDSTAPRGRLAAQAASYLGDRRAVSMSRSRAAYARDPRVDEYINRLPLWQQQICRQLRDLIHRADPEAVETIKRTVQPYFVLEGNVCALLAAKDHVNLFLYDGAIVPDPEGIITGGHNNRAARMISFYEGDTIKARPLTAMLKQIIANNRAGGWRKLKTRQ